MKKLKHKKPEHPANEKNASFEEQADWTEARYFAENAVVTAINVRSYLDGQYHSPSCYIELNAAVQRLTSAMDRALARRSERWLRRLKG